jgi:histidinol-phosphate aminotransferase
MSTEFVPPVRADLVGISAYGAPQLDVAARLNVNENPFPLPDSVVNAIAEAVRSAAQELNRYPERDAVELRAALAEFIVKDCGVELPVDQVWAANGSNEVMHQIFLAFGGPGRRALTFEPTYSMYPEYARDTFTDFRVLPRLPDFTVDVKRAVDAIADLRPSIVILTSPNNPTGTSQDLLDTRVIAQAALTHGAMVVVDEAYAEFRRDGVPSACELLDEFPNLIITRTMSKAFGLAGARLGYALVADPRVVDVLKVVRLPYHLSAITQAVAMAALSNSELLTAQVHLIRSERDALAQWLAAQGFDVAQSDANFILFGTFVDRHAVWQRLLENGVLVRETGPPQWLRVSVGTPEENAMFRDALLRAKEDQ